LTPFEASIINYAAGAVLKIGLSLKPNQPWENIACPKP